jgi:hypothetical protein
MLSRRTVRRSVSTLTPAEARALANLGIAYYVIGRHQEAVKAFEKATDLHGYELAPVAREAYIGSQEALRSSVEREKVEGWSTGEMPPVIAESPAVPGELVGDPFSGARAAAMVAGEDSDADDDVSAFFSMTEEDMRDRARVAKRVERSERVAGGGRHWIVVGAIVLVLLLIGGAIVGAFLTGLGYPTQTMTVTGMLDARAEGRPVANYWVAVPSSDIDREMAQLPPMRDYVVEEIDRSPRTSRVAVTVTPESGDPLSYEITLAREGVGWKVTGVEADWRSTGDGS